MSVRDPSVRAFVKFILFAAVLTLGSNSAFALPGECSNDTIRALFPSFAAWCEAARPVEREMNRLNARIPNLRQVYNRASRAFDNANAAVRRANRSYEDLRTSMRRARDRATGLREELNRAVRQIDEKKRELWNLTNVELGELTREVNELERHWYSVLRRHPTAYAASVLNKALRASGLGRVLVFRFGTPARAMWNPRTGTAWAAIDLPGHFSLTTDDLRGLASGTFRVPDFDPVQLALEEVPMIVIEKAGYSEWEIASKARNRYLSSRHFVDWMGLDQVANETVAGVISGGSTVSGSLEQARKVTTDELLDVLAWAKSMGIEAAESLATDALRGVLGLYNRGETRGPASVEGMVGAVSVVTRIEKVDYEYLIVTDFGRLGPQFIDAARRLPRDKIGQYQIPHLGFKFDISTGIPPQEAETLLKEWTRRVLGEPDESFLSSLNSVIGGRGEFTQFFGAATADIQGVRPLVTLINRFFAAGFDDPEHLASKMRGRIGPGAVLDLSGTMFADRIAVLLKRASFGSGSADVQRFTVDLRTGRAEIEGIIRHRVTLQDVAEAISRSTEWGGPLVKDMDKSADLFGGTLDTDLIISPQLRQAASLIAPRVGALKGLELETEELENAIQRLQSQLGNLQERVADAEAAVRNLSPRLTRAYDSAHRLHDRATRALGLSNTAERRLNSAINRLNELVDWWNSHRVSIPSLGGGGLPWPF